MFDKKQQEEVYFNTFYYVYEVIITKFLNAIIKVVCSSVVNDKSSCCLLLLDNRPTSPSMLDNMGQPAHEHQIQVTNHNHLNILYEFKFYVQFLKSVSKSWMHKSNFISFISYIKAWNFTLIFIH